MKYSEWCAATVQYSTPPRFGLDWFLSYIDKVWEGKSIKMDWMSLEESLRDCLSSVRLSDSDKVRVSKELIEAITRRGKVE